MRWMLRGCALLLLPVVVGAQQPPGRSVPAREVPVPDTASPELQKAIGSPTAAEPAIPGTIAGWRELQRREDASWEKAATAVATRLGATIESVEVGGVACYRVTPMTVAPGKEKSLLLHVHGGSFVFGGGRGAAFEAVILAAAAAMPALSVDYRRPPDHPYPTPVDDVLSVWKALIRDRDPKTVVMGGSSAGGTLIMSALLRVRDTQLPMPAAAFLGTPGADLSKTGDTIYLNEGVDHVLPRYDGLLAEALKLYAGGRDMKDPAISPVYADLSGFPPTVLLTGTRDLLLSATARAHRKLRAAGVTSEMHVYEGMSHGDYLLASTAPESRDALEEVARFFDRYLMR